jgi:hypothetical protein
VDSQGNIIRVPEREETPKGFHPISAIEERILRRTKKVDRPAKLEDLRQFCNARGPKRQKCRRLTHGRGNHRSLDGREWQS